MSVNLPKYISSMPNAAKESKTVSPLPVQTTLSAMLRSKPLHQPRNILLIYARALTGARQAKWHTFRPGMPPEKPELRESSAINVGVNGDAGAKSSLGFEL